jgi:hypothetical protein
MSKEAWTQIYRDAWNIYYTDAHVETVLRRGVASGLNPRKIIDALTIFSGATHIEDVHPLQFGFGRRKARTQRRRGMRIENPLLFYPRRLLEMSISTAQWLRLASRYRRIMRRVIKDPAGAQYLDEALQPPRQEDAELPNFVQVFADRIPKTHGAPTREAVAAK